METLAKHICNFSAGTTEKLERMAALARAGGTHLRKLPRRVTEHGGDSPAIVGVEERRSHNPVLSYKNLGEWVTDARLFGLMD